MRSILIVVLSLLLAAPSLQAQRRTDKKFVRALGFTVGGTAARQKWFWDAEPDFTEKKKWILGFNGSIFLEMLPYRHFRWVMEFQFNQKGCIEKTDTAKFRNRLNYISFNNYLKIRLDETYHGTPYFLIGPRLDYMITQKLQSPALTPEFKKIHFSLAMGPGFEFVAFSPWKIFAELLYDFDLNRAYDTVPLDAKNRDWELRVGLLYRFSNAEDCNAPSYSK